MTMTTTLTAEQKQQLADMRAGRPVRPTTTPITTIAPPKKG